MTQLRARWVVTPTATRRIARRARRVRWATAPRGIVAASPARRIPCRARRIRWATAATATATAAALATTASTFAHGLFSFALLVREVKHFPYSDLCIGFRNPEDSRTST